MQEKILICGEALIPEPLGALYWPSEEALIVSDLHFEKGSSFASRGVMLPPYDTRTTLMRLSALVRKYSPKRIISLGDAFHDGSAEYRMDNEDAETLVALMGRAEWLWVLGNHDPEPPARFAAASEVEIHIRGLVLRHEPLERLLAEDDPGEIAGHLHPCARVATEGRHLRCRCFAVDRNRIILPAMGAYTGGLNILDEAYAPLFETPVAWVMGTEDVYPIGLDKLVPDVRRKSLYRAG